MSPSLQRLTRSAVLTALALALSVAEGLAGEKAWVCHLGV